MCFFIFIVSFLFFYWFIKKVKLELNIYKFFLLILAILGGIAGGSLVYFIGNFLYIKYNCYYFYNYYSFIIGPIIEELVKFFTIYLVIINFKNLIKLSGKFWAIFGGLVGLSFGIYENLIYTTTGLSIKLLLYRIFIVGGLVHMLLGIIYGYIIYKSFEIHKYFPYVFKENKSKFVRIKDFFGLVKFIYHNSEKSLKVIFKFFLKVITLDVIIDNLLLEKSNSIYGHSPVEIIVESLIFGIFLHTYYNFSLSIFNIQSFSTPYLMTYILLLFWLIVIIYRILKYNKFYLFIILFIFFISISFYFIGIEGYKIWIANLLLVYFILIYLFISLIFKLEYL